MCDAQLAVIDGDRAGEIIIAGKSQASSIMNRQAANTGHQSIDCRSAFRIDVHAARTGKRHRTRGVKRTV